LGNIVATRGKNPKIIIGAHYDSFFHTQGAHDNASGTTALLALAQEISSSSAPDARLITFDAEEWNKLGSYKYVDALSKDALKEIQLMISIDSVGVGDRIYLLTSPSLRDKLIPMITNSGYQVQLPEANLDNHEPRDSSGKARADMPEVIIRTAERFPQFDSWPFMRAEIPVIQIGTLSTPPFLYWHDPRDYFPIIGNTGFRLIANVADLAKCILENWH
jgi:Zn-dependent M28 family amino/carboxypeptidase